MPRVPTLGVAKSIFHSWVLGLNQRRASSSTWPAGPSALYSARLARPSHTFLTIETPSISTQVVDRVSGCRRREECVFHAPKSKSNSCPSLGWLALVLPVCSAAVLSGVDDGSAGAGCFSRVRTPTKAGAQVLPPSLE